MKLYPMTIVFSESVTIGKKELAARLGLNIVTVTMMLKGLPVQVGEDYLDVAKEFNEEYAGEVTLLLGKPTDL